MSMKKLLIIIFSLVFLAPVFSKERIKFATVAPEGSTWMNVMKDFSKEVSEKTNGNVEFKIYGGMVQGDEKDVLRKIRINQLQSGGFTGVGLGEILPEVRILESPFMFKNKEEIDYIYEKFHQRFFDGFEKQGYILLGWAEVGYVYVYTNSMVRNTEEFRGVKMWMWEGDPLAEATFKAFNINPIPLSLADVLTSLQTGLIDRVYTSPLACITLQWFTKIKYFVDVPLTNSIGAVLVSAKSFKKLSDSEQQIMLELGKKYFRKLTELSRIDNKKSTEEILKYGIQRIIVEDKSVLKDYEEIGRKAQQDLIGKLYDQELLSQIQNALVEFRAGKGK
ncbi:MAG: TRAP transporter substrate-binding protein DctP [Calditrichaceae bacterium]|nr:TRAP transporter substrate-binding protein DctP [Calditrichaceae bacterium]RQV97272.1 MAG: ABC transporter substrate-binding protein [Calditrichota bacterium]